MTDDNSFSFSSKKRLTKKTKRNGKSDEDKLSVAKVINFKQKEFADLEVLFDRRPEFNGFAGFLRYLIMKSYKIETKLENPKSS